MMANHSARSSDPGCDTDEPDRRYGGATGRCRRTDTVVLQLCDVARDGTFVETEVGWQLLGVGVGDGIFLLHGTEFVSGVMKTFSNELVVMVTQHWECGNVVNATELYT